MPSKEEIQVVRKATAYVLKIIFKKGGEEKTYTPEEIEQIIDAYVAGSEQT